MKIKVGLNGFGRIGRAVLRIALEKEVNFEVVSINARANTETLAHMFKYDSNYGIFRGSVEAKDENTLLIDGKEVKITRGASPADIPWKQLNVDVVVESTGIFKKREVVQDHIKGGAKKVIITCPAKGEDLTVVMGVNDKDYDNEKHNILSNASCTTNCLAPFAKVLDEEFGIETGLMTTVHAYTNDQKILDKTHKDLRRARSAGQSIIPTTTGAAKAVALVLPQLKGKLNGFALRVPTPTVSLVDLVFVPKKKDITAEDINTALKNAAEGELKGILGYSDEPLVSKDYQCDPRSSIVDGLSTMVGEDGLVKVISWYDNEWGYASRTVDLVELVAEKM